MNYYTFGHGNAGLFTRSIFESQRQASGLNRKKYPFLCDLIVCRDMQKAKIAAYLFPFRKILLYQIELFLDTVKSPKVYVNKFTPVIVMNGFTGGIFQNNFHFLSSYIFDDEVDLGLTKGEFLSTSSLFTEAEFAAARPVIFVGKKRSAAELNTENQRLGIDLNLRRQSLAIAAMEKGVGDVAGSGWGAQAAYENSGFGTGNDRWWDDKLNLLKPYRFNIALENTVWKHYVTEKIWHSIKAGCLPVYWGKGSSIYETFPRNSFIDASEFSNSAEVIDFLIDMPYAEWLSRMKKCIITYNESLEKMTYSKCEEALNAVVSRVFEK